MTTPSIYLPVLLFFCFVAAQPQSFHEESRLLSIRQIKSDISGPNGTALSGCLLVLSNGYFYVERRAQRLPERTATLKRYEGTLSSDQLKELTVLLEDKKLVDLPAQELPVIPTTSFAVENLMVEIHRARDVQKVGYTIWRGPEKKDSIEGTSGEFAAEQFNAQSVLLPLLDWSESLRGNALTIPDPKFRGCHLQN
jgi:hypothetical protein